MSYLVPSAKKRRLNDAQSTLSKPFKSPLRRPVSTNASDNSKENETPDKKGQDEMDRNSIRAADYAATPTNAAMITNARHETTPKQSSLQDAHRFSTAPHITPKPTFNQRQRPLNPPATPTSAHSTQAQQTISALQKQISALHAELSALRTTLDTTTQAIKIEQSKQDPELEALIMKWRLVTREAAEELFAGARERVNRMGGVGAWRDKMKQSKLRRAEWDAPVDTGGGGDEDDDSAGSDVEKEKSARRREIEEEIAAGQVDDGGQKEVESEGEEDESFTMDMMLKNLNVDLKIVGFDKVNQRWVD